MAVTWGTAGGPIAAYWLGGPERLCSIGVKCASPEFCLIWGSDGRSIKSHVYMAGVLIHIFMVRNEYPMQSTYNASCFTANARNIRPGNYNKTFQLSLSAMTKAQGQISHTVLENEKATVIKLTQGIFDFNFCFNFSLPITLQKNSLEN